MEPGNDGEKIAKGRHRKTTPCCSNLVTELATTQRRKSVQRKQKKRKKKTSKATKTTPAGTWLANLAKRGHGTQSENTHTQKKKTLVGNCLEVCWSTKRSHYAAK